MTKFSRTITYNVFLPNRMVVVHADQVIVEDDGTIVFFEATVRNIDGGLSESREMARFPAGTGYIKVSEDG
jgi:hypothetical protein